MLRPCILAASLALLTACGSMSKETHERPAQPALVPAATTEMMVVTPAPREEPHANARTAVPSKLLLGTPSATKPRATLQLDHAPAPASLFGAQRTWKVTGHLFPGISAMNEREASAVHGSYVMSYTSLVTPWERCDEPVSTAREATVEEWFASYDARELDDTDRLTLHTRPNAKVLVHDLACKDGTQVELVELSADELAIARDGVIFTATRVKQ
jgi:hypothetical protein